MKKIYILFLLNIFSCLGAVIDKTNIEVQNFYNQGCLNLSSIVDVDLSRFDEFTINGVSIFNCHIHTLDLSNNNLFRVPESIFKLQELKYLSLSNNLLEELPESLGDKLVELNISNNQLLSLPEGIGKLNSLSALYVNNNRLTVLPDSFVDLTGLRRLDLSHNYLISLPHDIGNLIRVYDMNISYNKLLELPESMAKITELVYLNLSNNLLNCFPECICNYPKLIGLDISNNNITIITSSLGNLTKLEYLDLSENLLSYLPYNIVKLKYLRYLNLFVSKNPNQFSLIKIDSEKNNIFNEEVIQLSWKNYIYRLITYPMNSDSAAKEVNVFFEKLSDYVKYKRELYEDDYDKKVLNNEIIKYINAEKYKENIIKLEKLKRDTEKMIQRIGIVFNPIQKGQLCEYVLRRIQFYLHNDSPSLVERL